MRRFGRSGIGALVGLLSAAVALGVGETVAAFVRPAAAPVITVGNRFVVLTPESVKRWAIRNFGTNDKNALLTGIYLVLALFAIAIGILALRRLAYGIAGVVGFGIVGSYAALTARAHHASDVLPTIFGTLAGVVVMIVLARAADAVSGDARAADDTSATGYAGSTARRRFIQASAATAGLAALSGFGGRVAQHARFDVAAARAKVRLPTPVETAPVLPDGVDLGKSQVPWQTPNASFYRIDTALSVPQIDPNSWSVRIHGMVDREVRLTYAELTARPLIERWITLCCVSNVVGGGLISNARFLGARLADILNLAGVHPDADQLVMSSPDGMTIGAPTAVVMDGRDAMIAVGMNGVPLPVEHGFPARVVVPGLYGYVSACKWVVDIEATTYAAQAAYWVQGGWAAKTAIKLQSRIDTPHNGAKVAVGLPVAVAGIAWDQHVGVSRVEVQVNNGEWLPARLAGVPSTDTWRQWVVAWTPPAPGSYALRVRATDAAGSVQSAQLRDVYPSGATGLHSISVHAR
ncbi:MAG: molybdopterin-dependent oxidoreductase [Actinomycetota bacterium]|nr:molybdopterin-dependent oxidoreductase [Actinomycetota bacterium]